MFDKPCSGMLDSLYAGLLGYSTFRYSALLGSAYSLATRDLAVRLSK